jgi:tripartite-type tricarboxylate transporter receptor subunit TctC
MNESIRRRSALGWLASAGLAAQFPAMAQPANWPSKALRLIVPYPAGGSPDSTSRQVGDQVSRILGTSVVVENRPGGSALIGVRAMTAQPADNHTLVYLSSGHVTLAALPSPFDLLREVRLVTRLTNSPFVLVVNAESPYQTLSDLIKAIQARPGALTFGTAGQGSPAHMAVEFMSESVPGLNATHIPFKGAVESANAILGKQIDFTIGVLGALLPNIQGGKLRALGVTTPARLPVLPNVPTLAEAGLPGYQYAAWGGIAMHKDTPDAVVQRMHQALAEACATEAVRAHVARNAGVMDLTDSPRAFVAAVEKEIANERRVVKRLGLTG